MSSDDGHYSYGSKTFDVPERGEICIEDCPESIVEQLERASFERVSPNVFRKTQETFDEDTEYTVLTATVDGSMLRVEARDVVGIVSLTPTAKVQINPKIDWEPVFDMVLAVYDQNRSLEYRGVPLENFLADDIELSDIFLILALNYLEGIDVIHRSGFIRDLETRRADLDDVRGEIDVEQTLVNRAEGRTQHHCVLKEVEYDNPANSLLHYAGTVLLRLFRDHADEYNYPGYNHIFSQVHRELRKLEDLGVSSSPRRIGEYRSFSVYDLPRERHYYRKALDVSKAIATSSLSRQLERGQRELTIDYVINMESLFELYSQVVLEQQLERIKTYDHRNDLVDVTAVRSPSVKPFDDEAEIYHQPDHAIQRGTETLAILDSKYYADGHDPVKESPSRSRLFSYAYLLQATSLGFLCPLLEPMRRTVAQTGAELQIVAPDDERFTLPSYKDAIYEYLYTVLVAEYPELEPFRAVDDNELCLDGIDETDLGRAREMSSPFAFKDTREFSLRVVKAAADQHSWNVRNRKDLEQDGEWTREQIETRCGEQYKHTTTCIPVFRWDDGAEWIDLYFLNNGTGDIEREQPLKLLER
ncbi:restriction endonuclease [Natronococcus pandeyae]|uniref:Restriction endonuclease n=1 Tax=Natronococcus pandeyae TaxID=2055836 RepID=A0A8J8Q574_9EURY|nr:restriction endonuclease [Natronococcus pandeyae]TYL37425.1 restriction endonuclease [Natronococcus pandeyae]